MLMEQLGLSSATWDTIAPLQAPYGMILHCGPTGSGKSMSVRPE